MINMEQEFIENELIIVTKATLDKFLKEDNPADLIALYIFFYYTAKWQKTNIVKATSGYVKKGLSWGIDRLNKSQNKLIELGLISKVTRKTKGKITGWYIKVNYIFTQNNTDIVKTVQKPLVDETTCGKQETNALSTNSINALSTNKENTQPEVVPVKVKEVKPFSFKDEMDKLINSNYKPDKIRWLYFTKKKMNFENREQFKSNMGMCLKPAQALQGYNSQQIEQTMNKMDELGLSWTLNAIGRNISNVINAHK